ncbi:MAG TPA: hypothetical protein VH854_09260, partial [Thermoanaerobaculia bacterium]|nr:hypothetical protein [Thermoanaerobaculia bacterium]
MKRLILLSLCLSAAAAVTSAEVRALYRIVMTDGSVVLARDLPRANGSVTTFHASDSGVLTGVPSEEVAKIETSVTPRRFPVTGSAAAESEAQVRPLQPGEAIDLGPMGDGGTGIAPMARPGAAVNGASNGAPSNGNYANGGYANNPAVDPRMFGGAAAAGLLPNGQPANQAVAGDILRAQSANVPTMSLDTQTQTSPNGFPATVSSQTAVVNADGTVNATTAGPVPGAVAP